MFRTNSDGLGDDVGDFGEQAVTGRVTRLLWYDDSCESLSLLHFSEKSDADIFGLRVNYDF